MEVFNYLNETNFFPSGRRSSHSLPSTSTGNSSPRTWVVLLVVSFFPFWGRTGRIKVECSHKSPLSLRRSTCRGSTPVLHVVVGPVVTVWLIFFVVRSTFHELFFDLGDWSYLDSRCPQLQWTDSRVSVDNCLLSDRLKVKSVHGKDNVVIKSW